MMTRNGQPGSFFRTTLVSLGGPLIWSLHLALVYGGQHIACTTGTTARGVYWWVIGISLLALALLLPFVFLPHRLLRRFTPHHSSLRSAHFLAELMRLLAILATGAVLWLGLSVFFIPACAALF